MNLLSSPYARRLVAGSAAAVFISGAAWAATDTDNLSVTAEVVADCTVVVATDVAFGNYLPITTHGAAGADLDNTAGDIDITCTDGSSYTVTLGQGSNAGGGSTDADPDRRMISGGDFLSYSLFSDAGFTTEWGNTAGTGVAGTGDGAASPDGLTIYARVPRGQDVPQGSYADTVVVTVTF
ncbi:Csu type fimbrial protein [Pseudomarimonas arenosa]|uniref:Spore coat protein U domain-containing protein n=1 Tax=Pseudomarimonas arenosa TaxID=2774145 RepID=A0AAW3ZI42_9GAMM|nr:spore coat U domain-containing protein [Pseudomarimonas arenosa]MBD8524657.1 spore coat protein U domain-containing protein [Pseudomarimonas arenosa]